MKTHLLTIAFSVSIISSCSGEPDPISSCEISGRWHFGGVGGLTTSVRVNRLAPPDQFSVHVSAGPAYDSSYFPDAAQPDWQCSNAIPGCGEVVGIDAGSSPVTVADINRAFADPEVKAAFAASSLTSPVVFGHDSRPVDGAILEIGRDTDGRGFLVGGPCETGGCSAVPAGIQRLATLLQRLGEQQTTGACSQPD